MEYSASQLAALDSFRAVHDEMNALQDEVSAFQAQMDAATIPQRARLEVLDGQLTAALRGIQGLPA